MKKTIVITLLLAVSFSFMALKDKDPKQYNVTNTRAVDSEKLDANTISTWFRNNGSFNRDPLTGQSGFEWPKGSKKFARYASGLWLGARVGNDTLVAVAYYDYEYLPGYTDNSGSPQGKDDPLYRVYKITKGFQKEQDWLQWPNSLLGNSDQGAPVYYDNFSNSWKPFDFGFQTMFYVYTDSYPESHGAGPGGTKPMKADVKQINFAFNFGGELGKIAITQWIIINRNTVPWNDCYLTIWTDDDLGDATDDLVGCDTTIDLGYTYNGVPSDPVYGIPPPAVGFDFFRGAIIFTGNPNDIAIICDGKKRVAKVGYKQVGLSSFNWFRNDNSPDGDPNNFRETYRLMSGLRKDGSPIINPIGNYVTKYRFSGDPDSGTGWIQTGPDDQRFMQTTGPFTMNPNDTQIIVAAQLITKGATNLKSVTALRRETSKFSQKLYDSCFNVPDPPPTPKLSSYAPGNGKIYLAWDDAAEKVKVKNAFSNGIYIFQGYNVYQVRAGTNGTEPNDRKLIMTYDIKDGLTEIWDSVFIPEYNNWVYGITMKGSDNGISRFIKLEKDEFTGGSLINGTPYYYSVTAYSYDSLSGAKSGTPKANESAINNGVFMVIPQVLAQGTQVFYNFGDTIATEQRDLGAMPIVILPLSLRSAAYRSTFGMVKVNDTTFTLGWTLTRGTQVLEQNNIDFSGSQDTAKTFDGFMLVHQSVTDSGVIKDATDPAKFSRNIFSNKQGWTYNPPQNVWVGGPDTSAIKKIPTNALFKGMQFDSRSLGMSFPTSANFRQLRSSIAANGLYFMGPSGQGDNITGGPLRRIRIVFDNQSPANQRLAYRYVPPLPLPNDTDFSSSPYVDMVGVPFKVYAVDPLDSSGGTPRQLNVAFVDADGNGQWDPDTTKLGKYQITYIFASDYSSTPYSGYTTRNPGQAASFLFMDIMYAWVPRVKKAPNGAPMTYSNGDVLEVYPYTITRAEFVPNRPVYYQWTVQGSVLGDKSFASTNNQMDKVKVFPNPYFGGSRLENDPFNRFIYFSNLPSECTIYIYTLNGVLARKIIRNSTDPMNSLEKWNLKNQDEISVASGMYIVLVDAPGIGTKVLKVAIFTPEERIDAY